MSDYRFNSLSEKLEAVASVIYKHAVSDDGESYCQCGGWVYDEVAQNAIHSDHVAAMLDNAGLIG